MNGPRSHARERAAILGEVIERVLFDLRRAGADGAARDALERALVEIAAWASPSGTSEEHLAHLELRDGRRRIPRAAIADPRAAASISEVAGSLHRARAATIDAVVSAQDAELRATGPTAAGPAPPFLASGRRAGPAPGRPRLRGSPSKALGARAPSSRGRRRRPRASHVGRPRADRRARRGSRGRRAAAARGADRRAHARAAAPRSPRARLPRGSRRARPAPSSAPAGRLARCGALRAAPPRQPGQGVVALGTRERGASAIIDVVERAAAYARENTYGDNARAFALSFLLGCFEGDLRRARGRLGDAARATAALPGHAAALRLASGDGVGRATETLLLDSRAELVEIALEILTGRREAAPSAAVVAHLSHPSSRIVAAAARCLATVGEREAAIGALTELVERRRIDDRVFLAAAEALAVLGASAGVVALRERLKLEADTRGLEDRTRSSSAASHASPRSAPRRTARARPRPRDARARHRRALGWFGDLAHVDALLADFAMCGEPRRRGESIPHQPRSRRSRRCTGSSARSCASRPTPCRRPRSRRISSVTRTRGRMRGSPCATRCRAALASALAVRGSPLIVIDRARERRPCERSRPRSRELAIASGGASRLDVDGWVEAQLRELARLRTAFDRGAWPLHAGTWPGDH